MAGLLVLAGVFWGLCILSAALLRWNEVKYRKKGLPPGTMGWPVFGETTEFLKQGPGFMKNQRSRYGNFFKSHILGCPTVVSMDPELNRYILVNEAKGLVPGYPQSMLDILGKCNIAAIHGSAHKYMRGALLALISPTMIKEQLLLLAPISGYVIPKGWRIYVYTREVNYDPRLYPDPLTFNPWRWMEKGLENQHHFLIFGGGTRQCPGKELGLAEISTFLHYFVTKYQWEEVGGDKLMKFPRVEAPNGLHIKISTH